MLYLNFVHYISLSISSFYLFLSLLFVLFSVFDNYILFVFLSCFSLCLILRYVIVCHFGCERDDTFYLEFNLICCRIIVKQDDERLTFLS